MRWSGLTKPLIKFIIWTFLLLAYRLAIYDVTLTVIFPYLIEKIFWDQFSYAMRAINKNHKTGEKADFRDATHLCKRYIIVPLKIISTVLLSSVIVMSRSLKPNLTKNQQKILVRNLTCSYKNNVSIFGCNELLSSSISYCRVL